MKLFNHKTLYCRDVSGRVRVWWMAHLEGEGKYCTFSGLLDGEKVQSEFTQAEGKNIGKKNETSADKQALKEIEYRYKKQLKLNYFDKIEEIDNKRFFKPMLALSYKDRIDKVNLDSGKWGAQIKLNGNRALITADAARSRKGEIWRNCIHIEEALAPFFKKWPNAKLDGEFFNYGLREQLNELSSIVNTEFPTDEDRKKSRELVQFHIYDYFDPDNLDRDIQYIQRINWIESQFKIHDYIKVIKTEKINSNQHLEEIYNSFLEDKQEGAMLRDLTSPYEEGKRSKYLLKYKPLDDSECIILEIFEGKGNWSGTAKTCKVKWNNKEFDATFKGSIEQLRDILSNQSKWIGKKVTFLFNNLTGLKVPNFPRIDVNNCLKE